MMTHALRDYELQDIMGKGTFATVWRGRDRLTFCPVAAKQFSKQSPHVDAVASFKCELEILQDLDHPFIEQLYDVVETDDSLFLILEYVEGGSLLEFVNRHGPMPEHLARLIFIELVMAVAYLHQEKGVAHRDIKAENVLLDRNNNVRLIDFGLSQMTGAVDLTSSVCGSTAYLSPELFMGIKKFAKESDIWSLGVVLFAVCAGRLPFEDKNLGRLSLMVMNQEPLYPKMLSYELIDLLRGMLAKDPQQRLTISGIMRHPWVQGGQAVVNNSALKPFRALYNIHAATEMDAQLVRALQQFGMDTSNLERDLKLHVMNRSTAIYTSLTRERMTDAMASVKNDLLQVSRRFHHPHSVRFGVGVGFGATNKSMRSSMPIGTDFRIPSDPQILPEAPKQDSTTIEASPVSREAPLTMRRQAPQFQSMPLLTC